MSVRVQLYNSELFTEVDDAFAWIANHLWYEYHAPPSKTVYAAATLEGKRVKLHRLVMGVTDPRIQVDHRDRNGLNNRSDNLRIATGSQNMANIPMFRTNTSGFKGVNWDKEHNRWRSRISFHNKRIGLGWYIDPQDAARVYDKAALFYFGEFARLNFPVLDSQTPSPEARGNLALPHNTCAQPNLWGEFPARSEIATPTAPLNSAPVNGESHSDGQHLAHLP